LPHFKIKKGVLVGGKPRPTKTPKIKRFWEWPLNQWVDSIALRGSLGFAVIRRHLGIPQEYAIAIRIKEPFRT
jgi:hypothetical protein